MDFTGVSTHSNVVNEDITVRPNAVLTFTGIANNNISVKDSATLVLTGICNGNVEIAQSADVTIEGCVNGTVTNYGVLHIIGNVENLNDISHNSKIEHGATVNGHTY